MLTGAGSGGTPSTTAYENNGGSFTSVSLGLPDVTDGAVVWGDYNNDGNEDLAIAGFDGTSEITEVHTNGVGGLQCRDPHGRQVRGGSRVGDVCSGDGSNLDHFAERSS